MLEAYPKRMRCALVCCLLLCHKVVDSEDRDCLRLPKHFKCPEGRLLCGS